MHSSARSRTRHPGAGNLRLKWVMSRVGHADSKMTLDVYAQVEQRIERSHRLGGKGYAAPTRRPRRARRCDRPCASAFSPPRAPPGSSGSSRRPRHVEVQPDPRFAALIRTRCKPRPVNCERSILPCRSKRPRQRGRGIYNSPRPAARTLEAVQSDLPGGRSKAAWPRCGARLPPCRDAC
jgi:hypothetical protein